MHSVWQAGVRKPNRILLGFLAFVIIVAIGATWLLPRGSSPSSSEESVMLDEAVKLNTCRSNSITLIKPVTVDIFFLSQLSDFCYNQVRDEDLLGDFHVRKSNFVQQETDSRVLLWMVVAITISGVVLAGLQLLAAYRLSSLTGVDFAQGQGGEVKLDPKNISLKSSVTGLLILVISFAFFIVYVKWVYPIQTRMDPEAESSNARPALLLRAGGVGAPPGESAPDKSKNSPVGQTATH